MQVFLKNYKVYERRDERKNSCRGVWKRKVAHMKKVLGKMKSMLLSAFSRSEGWSVFLNGIVQIIQSYMRLAERGNDDTTCTWAG